MKRKAFSLVEIMQTVILLGIIAGLSISFFRKLNTDEKLYSATEKALSEAIVEAGRELCNDATPYCVDSDGGGVITKWTNNCNTIYPGSTYNSETGYCESATNIVPAEPYKSIHAADMTRREDGRFIVQPQCYFPARTIENLADPLNPIEISASVVPAVPFSSVACSTGVPDFSGDIGGVSPLCYQLHKLLNHKPQSNTEDGDLEKTCLSSVAFTNAQYSATEATAKSRIQTAIANKSTPPASPPAPAGTPAPGDNFSMVLSNGARLYNLGARFPDTGTPTPIYIFIKYDRIESIDTADWNKTIKAICVDNPANPSGACTTP